MQPPPPPFPTNLQTRHRCWTIVSNAAAHQLRTLCCTLPPVQRHLLLVSLPHLPMCPPPSPLALLLLPPRLRIGQPDPRSHLHPHLPPPPDRPRPIPAPLPLPVPASRSLTRRCRPPIAWGCGDVMRHMAMPMKRLLSHDAPAYCFSSHTPLITSLVVLFNKHRRIYSAYSQVIYSHPRRHCPAPRISCACASCS